MTVLKRLVAGLALLTASAVLAQVPDSVPQPAAAPSPAPANPAPATEEAPSAAKAPAKPKTKTPIKPKKSASQAKAAPAPKSGGSGTLDLSKVAADIDSAAAGVTSKIKADPKTAKAIDDLNNINKK